VVVVRYPGDPDNRKYVKRVIGLPGERLQIFDGKIFINEKILEEYYLPYGVLTEPDKTYTLGENNYFLMGDNRPVSNDSRYFGPVEKRFIVGQATTIIFPRFRQVPTL
jgi:signal peptidase I